MPDSKPASNDPRPPVDSLSSDLKDGDGSVPDTRQGDLFHRTDPEPSHSSDKSDPNPAQRSIEDHVEEKTPECKTAWTVSVCEDGHRTFAPVRCKNPWCPDCEEFLSDRAAQRARPYFRHMFQSPNVNSGKRENSLGHWTIRLPRKIQGWILYLQTQDGKCLTRCRNMIQDALEEHGYENQYHDLHLEGDESSEVWVPHWHVAVSDHRIPEAKLEKVKATIQDNLHEYLSDRIPESFAGDLSDRHQWQVHYRFKPSEDQMEHLASYNTRVTIDADTEAQETFKEAFYRWVFGRRPYEDGPLKNKCQHMPLGPQRSLNLSTCPEIAEETICKCGAEIKMTYWVSLMDGWGEIYAEERRGRPIYFEYDTRSDPDDLLEAHFSGSGASE